MIVGRSDLSDLEKVEDLSDPKIGTDGYGSRRHPTRWMVKLLGDYKFRRVYVCCISNAGTAYVEIPSKTEKGKMDWHVIEGSP